MRGFVHLDHRKQLEKALMYFNLILLISGRTIDSQDTQVNLEWVFVGRRKFISLSKTPSFPRDQDGCGLRSTFCLTLIFFIADALVVEMSKKQQVEVASLA